MERMAILAKTQKQHEGKFRKGGELQQPPPPSWERGLDVLIKKNPVYYYTDNII